MIASEELEMQLLLVDEQAKLHIKNCWKLDNLFLLNTLVSNWLIWMIHTKRKFFFFISEEYVIMFA